MFYSFKKLLLENLFKTNKNKVKNNLVFCDLLLTMHYIRKNSPI